MSDPRWPRRRTWMAAFGVAVAFSIGTPSPSSAVNEVPPTPTSDVSPTPDGSVPTRGQTPTSTPTQTRASTPAPEAVGLPNSQMVPTLLPLGDAAVGAVATKQGVSEALLPVLAGPDLPPPLGVLIADAMTGEEIVNLQGESILTPASTVKLLTAAAALSTFGAEHRVTTKVVASDDRTVVLVGGGDPLLTRDPQLKSGGASLTELAAVTAGELRAEGVQSITVAIDDSLFLGPATGEGWEAEDVELCLVTPITALTVHGTSPAEVCVPDYDPAISAGRIFAELLSGFGIEVVGDVARVPTPPTDPQVLAEVRSAPMSAMVEQMLTDSDNVAAEMLAHLTGDRVVGEASFAGGARATQAALEDLGVSVEGLTLLDGSGLSLLDRLSPLTASELLTLTATGAESQLWPLSTGLPVAGSTGTLADRFVTPATEPGRGEVRGKTGTLTGVSALSGQVVTDSGQLLTYVMISNGAADILASREALDQAASALAACGC